MSTFNKLSLSPQDYIDGLVEGTVDLEKVALLIVARALNIHIIVLCKERYWSTRVDKSHEDCQVKLAFKGGHSFKELTSKVADDFDKFLRKIYRKLVSVKTVLVTVAVDVTVREPVIAQIHLIILQMTTPVMVIRKD